MLIWRYLTFCYLKIFFLSVISFVAMLFIWRANEITQFIALEASCKSIFLFMAIQIPFILPIAMALSSLLAGYLTAQRLCQMHELSTLRASGLSIYTIVWPILSMATILSFATFLLSSECATFSHLQTRKMIYEFTTQNPLLALGNELAFPQIATVQLGKEKNENLLIAYHNKKLAGLQLLLADKVTIKDQNLLIKNLTLISSLSQKQSTFIENIQELLCPTAKMVNYLSKKGWRISNDHLKWKFLHLRTEEFKREREKSNDVWVQKELEKKIIRCQSERIRRIALGLCPLAFAFMGFGFGIHIGRRRSKKGLLCLIILTVITLITFFVAKELDSHFITALLLYLLPPLCLIALSWISIWKKSVGLE